MFLIITEIYLFLFRTHVIIYWGGLPAVPSVRYVKLSVDYEEVVTASCGRGKKTLLSWVRAAALKVF